MGTNPQNSQNFLAGNTTTTAPPKNDDSLYEESGATKKLIRVITVMAYLVSVSFAAIVLSAYYIFLWQPPNPRLIPRSQTGDDLKTEYLMQSPPKDYIIHNYYDEVHHKYKENIKELSPFIYDNIINKLDQNFITTKDPLKVDNDSRNSINISLYKNNNDKVNYTTTINAANVSNVPADQSNKTILNINIKHSNTSILISKLKNIINSTSSISRKLLNISEENMNISKHDMNPATDQQTSPKFKYDINQTVSDKKQKSDDEHFGSGTTVEFINQSINNSLLKATNEDMTIAPESLTETATDVFKSSLENSIEYNSTSDSLIKSSKINNAAEEINLNDLEKKESSGVNLPER